MDSNDCTNIKGGFYEFSEPIEKMYIRETVSKDGCKTELVIINDKWKMTPTGNPDRPFKKSRYYG